MKRAALAVAVVAVLAGCGATVNSGTVVSLDHEDAYTYYTSQCTAIGNNSCAVRQQIPHYVDEQWLVTLENCDLEHDAGDECPREEHEVTEQRWSELEVGDQLNLGDR